MRIDRGNASAAGVASLTNTTRLEGSGRHVRCPRSWGEGKLRRVRKQITRQAAMLSDRSRCNDITEANYLRLTPELRGRLPDACLKIGHRGVPLE
jgi:hypothetical protein